jgi:SNF2 family DNA or RNA helicase
VDWFDLKVVLNVTDTELTPDELNLLLNARGKFVRLGNKGWRRLEYNISEDDDARLAKLGLNANDFSAEPQRLHALQLADEAAQRFLPEEQVAEIRRRADEIQTRVTPPVPAAINATLRPYQLEGFHFLAYLSANRFGGILADDMGLGKTLQTLTWLAWLRAQESNANRKTLVVCPKSVTDNWQAEAVRFMPSLRVHIFRTNNGMSVADAIAAADVLVLNYAQLRLFEEELGRMEWMATILDEGQYIKNPDSQTARAARALKADHRIVLTGTPIENRLLDLWSLMAFTMPGVLGNRARFAKHFDNSGDPLARRRLSARVRPFLLRRTKSQVARELPDRIEEDLHCEMEGVQETLYRAELKRAQQMLLKVKTNADLDRERFNFLTSLLRLRQICCHPALVDNGKLTAESAKTNALVETLEPIIEEGNKILVFSQFVTMLDILKPILKDKGWKHFTLTGATEDRGDLVRKFQQTDGAAVFLISLKAGGFGLNLTAASYVVLFDPWWNPAVENQAIDRTHRIGQVNKVIAYRLLIKNSIEEKIRTLQKSKRALAEDVLGEENFAKGLGIDDLRYLFADD